MNPQVLVCDEPVSALDAHLQKHVVELLMRLQEARKLTVLFIGHDLAPMEQFCHRLLVLEEGPVAKYGATTKILADPTSNAARHLIENSAGLMLKAA